MINRWYTFWTGFLVLAAACFANVCVAQLPKLLPQEVVTPPASTQQPAAEADPTAKRQEVTEQLRVAQKALDTAKTAGDKTSTKPEPLSKEVELLKQLEVVHAQQQAANQRKAELEAAKSDLESKLGILRASGPQEPKPYSFTLLERLRDELDVERERSGSLAVSVEEKTAARNRAKAELEQKERTRRQAKEAVETNKDKRAAGALETQLSLAQLESQLAKETVQLREAELANEPLAEAVQKLNLTYLEEQVAWVAENVVVTARDREDKYEELRKREDALKHERDEAQADFAYLEREWFAARQRLDAAETKDPVLVEEVEAYKLARQVEQQKLDVVNQSLARLSDKRTAWNRRFKIRDTPSAINDGVWKQETESRLEQLNREMRTQSARLADARRECSTLEEEIESSAANAAATRWLRVQETHLQELAELYEDNLKSIDASRRLHEKLLVELGGNAPDVRSTEKFASTWAFLRRIWNYELIAVDDRPITPRKIVTGVFLLILGVFLSRWLSGLFGRRFLTRVHIHPSGVSAIQSVTFYLLLMLFALFALHIANVPLTAFTILGGAVALGVGFGSQNIINNFISGLIILAERPVRVGDMIEIDTMFATVEKIGARSTRVRTGSNFEIIVPNSKFLENNVVNWTLSDDTIRTSVAVGVIYGSPTDNVIRLLMQTADEHPKVLKQPPPFVLFTNFGDNSLEFEVHFWIRARRLFERLTVESEMRYQIDRAFRQANLVIAFPQRDVHLDMARPVEVRMLAPDPHGGRPETSGSDA